MPPSSVVVLADDLTSAADGAAPFRRAGHRALVLFEPPTVLGDGVTAVDLGTRITDATGAAARTRRAAGAYAGADILIKTVDSTLRGHVAAELRAALAGSGRRAAILAPAFPTEGRTTVAGVQYVRGVRVDASEFARDPAHPVRTADLARVLPEAVLLEPDALAELPRLVAKGGVFVCSARTDADLDALVAVVPRPEEVLWVGSPGLADALARHHTRTPAAPRPELPPVHRPLAVVGSANPASRRQLAALRAAAGAALHTPEERGTEPAALLLALVEEARRTVAEGRADGLVLTGGETAAAVLGALGATGIELYDEPEPGIARGTLYGVRPLGVVDGWVGREDRADPSGREDQADPADPADREVRRAGGRSAGEPDGGDPDATERGTLCGGRPPGAADGWAGREDPADREDRVVQADRADREDPADPADPADREVRRAGGRSAGEPDGGDPDATEADPRSTATPGPSGAPGPSARPGSSSPFGLPSASGLPVLVKAGGFGDDGTLVRLTALLARGTR